ncbi:hypothetical protein A2870_01740 [Candidatus Curtissbacteria bacterium RIFCSPHIGHO2_01_FULL_41_11]|uniref:Methyltransferase FkbM domain-containing protein n=1 Tax=Candidatus Curtissbacteria bacterium RIFCSPHIGHO2_01_FULL_41_11 TaxID=1797711 RepID=A0A1F5G5C7_9BACT|nr:MAG: hypothetical protein A2870_01740 [Candidatus Curtissbacteria bacterium RIFCSPHIGHO2_01_FULL_41_11]
MTLGDLKKAYLDKKIPKDVYIEKMFELHKQLFAYSKFIKNTDIERIEISTSTVIVTTSEEIKLIIDEVDRRLAPVEILNFGSYEKSETEMILQLAKDTTTVFDIGANIGWYSLMIAKRLKNAKIFAFEPIKKTFDYLKLNIKLNSANNIKPYNLGFADSKGQKVFYLRKTQSGSASMANIQEDKGAQKVVCKIMQLDEFVKAKKLKVDFIKCDTEGSELLVFKGAKKTILNNRPIILAEMLRKWSAKFNYHPNEIIDFLKSAGYLCFIAKNKRLKKFSQMTDSTKETNFFFLHPIKHKSEIEKLS